MRAREPSGVATITEKQFHSIAEQHPAVWKNLAKMLVTRLHATDERVTDPVPPTVFIGYGRSPLWARVQTFLEHDCRLPVLAF